MTTIGRPLWNLFLVLTTSVLLLVPFLNSSWKSYSQARLHQQPPRKVAVKNIFLATGFFGHRDWYFITNGYGKKGSSRITRECPSGNTCIVSFNATDQTTADALLFHARDTNRRYPNRRPGQIYIMYSWESPWYQGNTFIHGGDYYNWSATYHRKADVRILSGVYFRRKKPEVDALRKLPQFGANRTVGNATIAWVVSNCGAGSKRLEYMRALRKHLAIDIYGGCGQKRCPNETHRNNDISCHRAIGQTGQYKFYLAFENSICEDYVSLKPFRAMNSYMVPIVLGGKSADDYPSLLPPNSYLDVRNFTNPKALAEHLKFLDGNDTAYLTYHQWRANYWLRESGASYGLYNDGALMLSGKKNRDLHWMCAICDAVHDPVKIIKPKNIDWGKYWNHHKMCDPNLVYTKLKG